MKAAAASLSALAAAPLRAPADPLSVFQPGGGATTAPAARGTATSPFRSLAGIDAFGTFAGERLVVDVASTRADATALTGFPLRVPGALPPDVGFAAVYRVSRPLAATFTFSAAKAEAWARERRVPLAPIPAGLDRTVYTIAIAPVVTARYGAELQAGRSFARTPYLGIVQSPLPRVRSNGAPIGALAAWLSQQRGVAPALAAGVREIGDPLQTLPVPAFFDRRSASDVRVDGVRGLAVGDDTGLGAAVVWIKDGTFFAVGGTLTETELLAVAGGLR